MALWLAADVAVTTDADQRVVAWQDIVYGDNESAEDAVQPNEKARPTLVANAVHGGRRFASTAKSNFLLTTPLETTDDQTVVFVCQFSPSAFDKDRRWGGQIINYDGPPSRYLSNTLEPGVLQIGEPLLENEFKPTLLTGQVFAGFIGSATVEAGRVDAAPVGADEPVIVSYVYDYEYENGRSDLAINGQYLRRSAGVRPAGHHVAQDHRPARLDAELLPRRPGRAADLQQGPLAAGAGRDHGLPGGQVLDQVDEPRGAEQSSARQ